MDKTRIYLIHMLRCRGITRRTVRNFMKVDPTLREIYSLSPEELNHYLKIPMKNASVFYNDLHNSTLKKQIINDLKSYKIITIVDEIYPNMLKRIKDPPMVLYVKGDITLLHSISKLSIIGTRNPSSEAFQKTKLFVQPLIKHDFAIVSGMARGIDSYAHQLTLKYGGKTIAVLGSGFNHIYPKENTILYQEIVNRGLIISEYPPDAPPRRYHFPERNRIISGLSFGTLVIEATERSGTLITVDQALDQGREVFVVPGSPLLPQTKGCHQMIQDGAKLVTSAKDILEDWKSFGYHLLNS